jgi:NAD-dependent dihydropyrimidine dehydrogenase PreA subunit
MTELSYIRGVTTIELDLSRCNGCRMCMRVCPHPVFGDPTGSVQILEPDMCIECGACVINCPEGALSVNPGVGCAAAILKGWITGSKTCCE